MITKEPTTIDALPNEEHRDKHFEILNEPSERVMIEFGIAELIHKVRDEHYDSLVFLDKSARSFSWMFDHAWKKLFPNEERPSIHFVNPPRAVTASAESEYQAWMKEHLRGDRILLVDEISHSGGSFERSKQLVASLPSSDHRKIDTFEVMQTFPGWYGGSDVLTGTADSAAKDDPFSVPNPTPQSLKFRNEFSALADQLVQDFSEISLTLDRSTNLRQDPDQLQAFFDQLKNLGVEVHRQASQENWIDHDALLLELNHLSEKTILTLYGLIRRGVIEFEYVNETGWNLLNHENNLPFKKLSEAVRRCLPHANA